MRLKMCKKELLSSYEVESYIQNEFVEWIDALREAFKECEPSLNERM
jgi:hypothetical protein